MRSQTIALTTDRGTASHGGTRHRRRARGRAASRARRATPGRRRPARRASRRSRPPTQICAGDRRRTGDATPRRRRRRPRRPRRQTATDLDRVSATPSQAVLDGAAAPVATSPDGASRRRRTALDALLATLAGVRRPPPTGSTRRRTPSQNSAVDERSGRDRSAPARVSSSPSAADLIAYQKAVDAAAVQTRGRRSKPSNRRRSSARSRARSSPSNLAVGDDVTAGSATADIVIVGAGGYEVTTTVERRRPAATVKVGQAATIIPDGSRPSRSTVRS